MLKAILKDWWFYVGVLTFIVLGCVFDSSMADIGTVTRGNPAVYENGGFIMRPSSFNFTGGGVSVSSSPSGVTITISSDSISVVNSTLTYILEGNATAYVTINDNAQTKTGPLNIMGNVGLGTLTPFSRVHVSTKNRSDAFNVRVSSTWADVTLNNFSDGLSAATGILFDVDDTLGDGGGAGIVGVKEDAANSVMGLAFVTDPESIFNIEAMRLTSGGNLGIGTTNPVQKLHVATGAAWMSGAGGSFVAGGVGIRTANRAELHLHSNGDVASDIIFGRDTRTDSNIKWDLSGRPASESNSLKIFEGPFNTGSGFSARLTMMPGGNIGLGTASPSSALDIFGGSISVRGTNAGISINGWSVITSSIALETTGSTQTKTGGLNVMGSVGIGTGTVRTKLGVLGNVAVGTWDKDSSFPENGLAVTGKTQFGGMTAFDLSYAGAIFGHGGNTAYSILISTVQNLDQLGEMAGVYQDTNFSQTATSVDAFAYRNSPIFTATTGESVDGYTFYSAPRHTLSGSGARHIHGGYFARPSGTGTPTSRNALYTDDLNIGYTNLTPPTSGAIVAGRFGIGTSSPTSLLDVAFGTVTFRDGFIVGGGTLTVNGGNVGIGTTIPNAGLHVANAAGAWGAFNYGTNLIIKDAATGRNNTIGIFDAAHINPWAITNAGGNLIFSTMPALGDTSVAPGNRVSFRGDGNVGIGTMEPSGKLHVFGGDIRTASMTYTGLATLATGSNGMFYYDTTLNKFRCYENGGWINCSSGTSQWITNGASIYYPTGNVGIGTDTPISRLEIKSSGVSTNPFSVLNSSNANQVALFRQDSSGHGQMNLLDGGGTSNVVLTSNRGSASYINAGNVGIGINVPAAKTHIYNTGSNTNLTVQTTETPSSGNEAQLDMKSGDDYVRFFYRDSDNNFGIYHSTGGGVNVTRFRIDGSGNMRLNEGGGNVGIGTASPIYNLHISSTLPSLYLSTPGANGAAVGLQNNNDAGLLIRSNVWRNVANTDVVLDVNKGSSDLGLNGSIFQLRRSAPGSPSFTGTSLFLIDASSNLVVGHNGGNVGVGTTAPASKVDVLLPVRTDTYQVRVTTTWADLNLWNPTDGLGVGAGIRLHADNGSGVGSGAGIVAVKEHETNSVVGLAFVTDPDNQQNIEAMRISGSGNVGISTPTPVGILQVTGGTLTVLNTGLVGIGTTIPRQRLHIHDPAGTNNDKIIIGDGVLFSAGVSTFTQSSNIQLDLGGAFNIGYNQVTSSAPNAKLYIHNYSNDEAGPGMYPIYVEDENSSQQPDFFLRSGTNGTSSNAMAFFGGNVGIGTQNPTSRLSVIGSGTGRTQINDGGCGANYAGIALSNAGTLGSGCTEYSLLSSPGDNLFINRPNGQSIFFREANSTQMMIDPDGDVGIGTSNPEFPLHVKSGNGEAYVALNNTSAGYYVGVDTVGSVNGFLYADNDLGTIVGSNGNFPLRLWTNGSDRIVIQKGGNVGIGSSAPLAKLDVSGATFRFGPGTTNPTNPPTAATDVSDFLQLYAVNNGGPTDYRWYIEDDTDESMSFYGGSCVTGCNNLNNSLIIMRLMAGGNVGIGTTTPVRKLQVAGDARVGTGTTGCVEDADGTAIAGTCSSDERFKTVVGTMAMVLSSFTMLEPKYYHWKVGEFPTESWGISKQLGLIAQDVEPIIPQLVFNDDNGFKKVRYEQLPMYFLKSLKEMYEEIQTLKKQIKVLEGRK